MKKTHPCPFPLPGYAFLPLARMSPYGDKCGSLPTPVVAQSGKQSTLQPLSTLVCMQMAEGGQHGKGDKQQTAETASGGNACLCLFAVLVGLPCGAHAVPQTTESLSTAVPYCHPWHEPPGLCSAGLQGHRGRQGACVHANVCHRASQNGVPRGCCYSRAAPSAPASASHLPLPPIHM